MKTMFNSCLLPRIFKQSASFLNAVLKKAIEEMCKAATPSDYFVINHIFKSANVTECKNFRRRGGLHSKQAFVILFHSVAIAH